VSRYIDEPITVHVSRESRPTAFIWRKRLYRVSEILTWWREAGDWWNGEPVKMLIRVTAECGSAGTFEICRRGADWSLRRLLD
jgi:hypothetical protein